MSDISITIQVPKELVERAKAVGLQIEDQTDTFIELLETQIRKREAGQELLEIANKLTALPDDMKPTQDEIDTAIRDYWKRKSEST